MKVLITMLILNFSAYGEGKEEENGLFSNQKEKLLKELNEQEKENVDLEEVECIEKADNRNALNRCKMEAKNRKRKGKK